MRAVVQRVSEARVVAEDAAVAAIGRGLCVLLGVAREDGEEAAERLAGKVARLRIFENEDGRFDRSLLDVGGAALVVSQFTLIAESKRQKGTRPDFSSAAPATQAEPLYEAFCKALRELGVNVEQGVFGARMAVQLINEGPSRSCWTSRPPPHRGATVPTSPPASIDAEQDRGKRKDEGPRTACPAGERKGAGAGAAPQLIRERRRCAVLSDLVRAVRYFTVCVSKYFRNLSEITRLSQSSAEPSRRCA